MTTVTASDLDLGANGVIRYSITNGNIRNAFTIGGTANNDLLQ